MEERRKIKRINDPHISLAVYNERNELGPLFGRVHDINQDGLCVKLDEVPKGNSINIVLRMFKKDLKFNANVIRSEVDGSSVFVVMLFDWDHSSIESRNYLSMFLNGN